MTTKRESPATASTPATAGSQQQHGGNKRRETDNLETPVAEETLTAVEKAATTGPRETQ
jgi:hypothetical protein